MTTEEKTNGFNVCRTIYSCTLPKHITLSLSNIWVDQPMQESPVYTGKVSITFLIDIRGSSIIMPSHFIPNGLTIRNAHTLFSYVPDDVFFKSETKAKANLLHIEIDPINFIELFGDDLLCSQKISQNKLIYHAHQTDNKQLPGLNHLVRIMQNCALKCSLSKMERVAMEAYLLSYLVDTIKETNKYLSSRRKKAADYSQIITQRIRGKILADLSQPPSLVEIAEEANISVSTLQNYCKKELGTTLFNFYQKERMRYAYECINRKKMSVTETAVEVGYSNFSHFSAAFCKQFGFNPSKISN